ncbi:MAG: DUF4085 domain-containing protein, partial [bacterium]|nr:DUF4085 domain-containing protein [bacterium]
MKFITRELYQSMQDDSDSQAYEAAEQAWYAQCKAYREHLNSIRERLPISMQSFCDITLHDGVIQAAEHCNSSNVRLVVDASHNPWGPTGNFQLSFLGVKQV